MPAAAYRPFDGTDAAVADVDEVEIELQPAGVERAGSEKALIAPFVVYNYGFAKRWEFVLQGQAETPLATPGPTSVTNSGAFLKYVIKEGTLQEKSGPSIATEFGPLLPDINGESGTGVSWAGIISQRWDWGTVHFNAETNLTRDHRGELFLDAIIEGPYKWPVRPVCEIFTDTVANQSQTFSVLAGAIWQVRDSLSFDLAYRHAFINSQPVDELRAGLTFGFSAGFGQPSGAVPSDSMPSRRR